MLLARPQQVLQHLKELTYIERKPLRFCSEIIVVGENVGGDGD